MSLPSSNTLILVIRKECQPKIASYLVFVVFTAHHFTIRLKHVLLQKQSHACFKTYNITDIIIVYTHGWPVYLWACSVNCSLVTEWGRCWFCPAPLANLQPIRIHHSLHRMIGVERNTAACAYRSRRREGRCLNSHTLLWPGPRWTAEMRREPPYRYLTISDVPIWPM